jgi:cytochrome P450 family 4
MLDTLLAAETKGLIDSEGIREEVDTFTFEGHGTTGMGLIFTLLLLAHHPEAQEKILLEVKETQEKSGLKKFTVNDLNNMKYLDCVIKESLRLFPPGPYFARTLTEDLELGLDIFKLNFNVY